MATAEAADGGTIGDLVWSDSNENGRQDAGEPGVAGVNVTLSLVPGGTFFASTTTSSNGTYSFTGLELDRCYRVSVMIPTGSAATLADVGGDDGDSDINNTGVMPRWACPGWGRSERLTWDAGLIAGVAPPPVTTTTTVPATTTPATTVPATTTPPTTGPGTTVPGTTVPPTTPRPTVTRPTTTRPTTTRPTPSTTAPATTVPVTTVTTTTTPSSTTTTEHPSV
jgi:hypothetical protein